MKLAKLLVIFGAFSLLTAYFSVVSNAPIAQKAKGDGMGGFSLNFVLNGGNKSLSDFNVDYHSNQFVTVVNEAHPYGLSVSTGTNVSFVPEPVSGYTITTSGDCSGTIQEGVTLHCTITNTSNDLLTPTPSANPTVSPTTDPSPTLSPSPTVTVTPSASPTVTPTQEETPTPTPTGDTSTGDTSNQTTDTNDCSNTNQSNNVLGNNNNNCNQQHQSQDQNQYNNNNQTVNISYEQPQVLGVSYPTTATALPSTGPAETWELIGALTPLGFILRKIAGK